MSNLEYLRKTWFMSGAYIVESFASYRSRLAAGYNSTVPVFLRPQAD